MVVEQTYRLSAIAQNLWDAEVSRQPTLPLTASGELPLDMADAYAVQRMNLIRRFARGERTVGHKVGLSSKAMQEQLKVDGPDFGVITDAMLVADDGSLDLGKLIAPRIEAEFAFTLSKSFPGWARPRLDDLKSAISGISLAIEVIDSRVIDWNVNLADTVADNASCARVIVGSRRRPSSMLFGTLPATTLTLTKDEVAVAWGLGAAALGDPLVSLQWISQALHEFGEGLEKGDVILAGAVHASIPLTDEATWGVSAGGFEPVRLKTHRV